MQALRFHAYGEPSDVLRLEDAPVPEPRPGQVRVRVAACGLNPADWYLCRGMFPGNLPNGVGLDVAGVVTAVGGGVGGVRVGDAVLGIPDYLHSTSAGAAEEAVLLAWAPVPDGLDLLRAAVLTMAVETANRCLNILAVGPGRTLFVYGAGTTVGYAAVQMAIERGARVVAAAGATFAADLRGFGAEVIGYGDGLADRVARVVGGAPDLIFDAGPISDVLPRLVGIAGGDARRVLTVSNHGPAAEALGVRDSFGLAPSYDVLPAYARLAAEGRFTVPIARVFPLADWRDALEISLAGHAHGKLVLLPPAPARPGAG